MSHNENDLKSDFMKTLRKLWPKAVTFRHEDKLTSGIPDLSITANGKTSWVEFKHANPNIIGLGKTLGVQELTMLRLGKQAFYAIYVIWLDDHLYKDTLIVQPRYYRTREASFVYIGFDHESVVHHLRVKHEQ